MGSPDDFSDMLRFVEKYHLKPVIDAVHALEKTNQAIEQMRSSPQFGKYVLQIS